MWGPLGIAPGFRRSWAAKEEPPDFILLLGGDTHREQLAAEICGGCLVPSRESGGDTAGRRCWAERWAKLPVWVSSAHGNIGDVMGACGVKAPRLTVDTSAVDTVTNFTSTVDYFQNTKVKHVAVFTSDYHARRSGAIASIVFGGTGIAHTLVELPSPQSSTTERHWNQETGLRVARDIARAVLWLLIGFHGGEIGRFFHPERFRN